MEVDDDGEGVYSDLYDDIYGDLYDEEEGCCGSLYQICRDPRLKHQLTVVGGVLEDHCKSLIKTFFQQKRKKL